MEEIAGPEKSGPGQSGLLGFCRSVIFLCSFTFSHGILVTKLLRESAMEGLSPGLGHKNLILVTKILVL